MTKEQKTCRGHMSELHRLACPICNPEKSTCTTPLPTDTTQDTGRVKTTPEALTSNEQVYRDALVAIRDRLQLRRKSHEDTQRDNDYAYQNANEALFATGAGFAPVSDETPALHVWSARFECSHCKAVHDVSCSQPYFKVTEFECLRCHALTEACRPMRQVETGALLSVFCGIPIRFVLEPSMPADELRIEGANGRRVIKFGASTSEKATTRPDPGVAHASCNYLAPTGGICTKCGWVDDEHK